MDQFDEYQKLMRYKYGYHSFAIVLVLTYMNFSLDLFFDIQWAETKSLEFMLLVFPAVIYAAIMSIYRGAYFNKKQKPKTYVALFFFIGIANFYLSFSPYSPPLIIDGLVTSNSIRLVSGLLWTSIPVAYLTRVIVEKKRDSKDIDED